MIMVIPSGGSERFLLLVEGGGAKVLGDIPGRELENSFEDTQPLHPLADQSEEQGKDPLDMLCSDL